MQDEEATGPHGLPAADEPPTLPEAGLLGRMIDRGGIVFALGILASMLVLIQEVVLRYVFNAPTIWAHETTVFLCAIAFVYGGLYCAARNQHIRVVIVYDVVEGRAKRLLDAVISVICMLSSAIFAWAAWIMVARAIFRPDGSVRLETSGSAWNPPYPALLKLFLLVVLAVMAVQFAILALGYARGRRPR
jgi:TRAP-type C4-dicarboxylate transport system permease small subunit